VPTFFLGAASNYAILFEGGGNNIRLGIANSTTNTTGSGIMQGGGNGNIGIGGVGEVSVTGGGSNVNGNIDFSAANTGQFSGIQPQPPGTVNYNVAAVTSALSTVNALNTTLGALPGTNVAINGDTTINASNGTFSASGAGYTSVRVFNVTSFSLMHGQTLTINGDVNGDSVVLNFTTSTDFDGNVVLTGGLTPDNVLFNFVGGSNLAGGPPLRFNTDAQAGLAQGIFLDPNGLIGASPTNIFGRLFGGDSANFQFNGGSNITAPGTPQLTDLALTKTVDNAHPNVGDTVTYTVTASNNGPAIATGVKVIEALPAGLTFVSAMSTAGSYNPATRVWTVGTVAVGAMPSLQIMARVVSPNAQTNTAVISGDQSDPDSSNNQATVTVTPQQADLVVGKRVSNPTPNVGDTITYTVTVANDGPSNATGVTLQEVLPAQVGYLSSSATQGSFNPATRTWTVGSVAVGVTQTLTITALVTSPNPQTNTASISHADQFDPNPNNNSDTASITPQQADLELTKFVSNPTPNVGDTVTFTVGLTNNGPNNATGVQVTDQLPAGLTFVSYVASQGTYTSSTGLWVVGALANTASATLTITALVASPNAQTNTATITHSDQFDPVGGNNQASATVTPQQADLAVGKRVDDPRPNVGETITFFVTLGNRGPDAATNVQLTDHLPAGLTFVSYMASQGTYNSATGVWTVGTLANGGMATLQLRAMVVSPNAQTNTATISHSDQFDPDQGRNQASVTVTPQQADLVVGKQVSNPTPNVGDTITYTVTVGNNGPNNATGVTLSDVLPAQVMYLSSTATSGSYDPATRTWTVGGVPVGVTQTLTIMAMVTMPGVQANTAGIMHADQFDPVLSNNSDTASITPQEADLALSKIVSNPRPNVGDTVTFTVTLTNNGFSNATGVQVTDPLPAGLTFVSATPSQGTYASSTGLWVVGALGNTASATLTITARVVSPVAATNLATISHSDQFDPDAGNNQASTTVTPQQSDLALLKAVDNPTPNVGDTVTFTVTLSNHGPDAATNVSVADVLPAGLALISAAPSQGTYGSGVWTVGTVTSSVAQTLILTARVVSPGQQTNTATISHADQFDPNPNNNQGSATVTPQEADLVVGKRVSNPTPNVGDVITYTVTLANDGPNNATGVTLQDVLPAQVSYLSSTATVGSYDPATRTWTVGSVPVGVTQMLTIMALVTSPNPQTNTAAISHSDQFDPDTSNNSNTASITPQQADLELTKIVSNPRPNVGDMVTFTVGVTNNGPSAGTGVHVADLLPAGLSFVSATPSQGTYSSSTGLWVIGALANTASATLTITAHVVSPNSQTNTATISHSDQFDPNGGNNQARATVTPQLADLALFKGVDDPTPNVGDTVTFTVTLSNRGPDAATNVSVADVLPAGLMLISATPSQGTYAGGVWTVGTVSLSATPTLILTARVTNPNSQTNTAMISHADQFDPNPNNNQGSATVTPQQADLVVGKQVSNPTPNVGDVITYTVTVANDGPNNATGVTLQDVLPAQVAFQSSAASAGSYDPTTRIWTVGSVPVGVTQTLTLMALVTMPGVQANTASISHADQFDPDTSNNSDTASITPQEADLALTKFVSNPRPNVGDTVTFSVTLTNNGFSNATGVEVTDQLPAGLTFVSATPSQGTYTSSTGLWTVGALANTASATLTITALVASPNAQTNTATISHADQVDPDTGNNSASTTVTPQQADLALTKTISNPTPNVGDTVIFTVTLSNHGPDVATNVSVADVLPAGLALISAAPSQGTYVGGVWTVGTVSPSVAQTLTLTVRVVSPGAETNTATINHADQFDPNPGNNSGSATVTPQQADLAIAKTVSNPTPNVGDAVTFTVTLSNHGPDAATHVSVADMLPAGLMLVSAAASQGIYAGGVWTVGTVDAGAAPTLILQARVVAPQAQTNIAAVTHSDQFDPNSGNNSASATVTPQQADLALTKSVDNATPIFGTPITFTITVTNHGPNTATNAIVADPLPPGLILIAAAPSQGVYNNASGVWIVGTLANGATATLRLTVNTTALGPIVNNAEVRADQFDQDIANNQASRQITVMRSPAQISKLDFLASTILGPSMVQVRRDSDGALLTEFAPYGPSYSGPISVAVGDISGDGVPDLVTAAGVGNPDVRVYDGRAIRNGTFNPANPNASLLAQWFAYGINFNIGATVAVGDIEKDGFADIVTGATAGNPHVKVFSGRDIAMHRFDPNGSSVVAQWFAYGLQFNIGVNVAVGDVSGNGYADIVTGATAGNPHVKVYSGKDIALHTFAPNGSSVVAQWFAFGLQFNIGANVAVADINGDGFGDVIVGAASGNSHVKVYDGRAIANGSLQLANPDASLLNQFFAYNSLNANVGVTVAAADFERTRHFDIVTGPTRGPDNVRVVRGTATGMMPPAVDGIDFVAPDRTDSVFIGL